MSMQTCFSTGKGSLSLFFDPPDPKLSAPTLAVLLREALGGGLSSPKSSGSSSSSKPKLGLGLAAAADRIGSPPTDAVVLDLVALPVFPHLGVLGGLLATLFLAGGELYSLRRVLTMACSW